MMNPMISPSLPPALAEAVSHRRLLIFCGAGASMLPPSNLPSWWGFNQSILDEAKRLTLEGFPGVGAEAANRIRALSLDHLPVEAFSDTLVRTFAGPHYFPVLEVLDSDRPNANHRALAELGKARVASVFVTTNFDTLIERAFRQAAVPLRVFVEEMDYLTEAGSDEVCQLYKIHGSVKSTASLVDTVSQKLRGIPLEVRGRLAALFRRHHVLVLGYSGADLSFGDDYLALSVITEDCPGITWLLQPGRQPAERVRQVVERAGTRGAFVEGTLPDFLKELGVALSPAAVEGEMAGGEDQTGQRVRQFFTADHVGPFASAAFCASLLWIVGDGSAADALLTVVASHPEMTSREVSFGAGVAFRTLSRWAMRKGNFPTAIKWLNRELGYYEGIAALYGANNLTPSPEAEAERASNLAGLYNNLGLCFMKTGDAAKAGAALEMARQQAEAGQHFDLLSLVYLNKAQLEESVGGHPDRILGLLHNAEAFAANSGTGQTLYQAKAFKAKTLALIAEYDEALVQLRQAEQYASLVGGMEGRLEIDLILADIHFRRGDMDGARDKFRQCIALAEGRGSRTLADQIRFQFGLTLCTHAPFRQEVIGELRGLLRGHDDAGSLSREKVEGLLNLLLGEELPPSPPVLSLRLGGDNDPEAVVRRAIADCEFNRRVEPLPALFAALCRRKYQEKEPERLLQLANAFLAASERAGQATHRAEALNFIGVARDLLGDARGALDAYEAALQIAAVEPVTHIRIKLNAALVKSTLEEGAEAEALFNEVIVAFRDLGEDEDLVRSVWGLAEHFARGGRLSEAVNKLEEALALCDKLTNPGARRVIEARRALWRQRLTARREGAAREQDVRLILSMPGEAAPLDSEQLTALRPLAKSAQGIGNLALVAATSGLNEEALNLTKEAFALYREAGDLLGLSRCWSNLASIALNKGQWEKAVEHLKKALDIRIRLEDIDGQILLRSNMALCCEAAGDHEQAREHAGVCLNLTKGRPPTRPVAVAWHVLALVHAAGRGAEALHAARRFVETYTQVDAPGLESIFKHYRQVLAQAARPTPPPEPAPPSLNEAWGEASRLKALGDYDGALSLLGEISAWCRSAEDRAMNEGNIANVFQSAGRHEEAVAAYRRAAESLRECGQTELAWQADIQCAASMRLSGDAAGSEAALRAVLQQLPPIPLRANAIIALCNTLSFQAKEGGRSDEQTLELIAEAHHLYDDAREVPEISAETRGLIELNSANLSLSEGEPDEALHKLALARQHLLRCNSRHLDHVEKVIEQVRGLLP